MGFRKGRGCTDAVFTLINTIQLQFRHKDGREVYGIFVDLKRAFDSVPQWKLWQKLHHVGTSTKFINTIKSLYDKATIQIVSQGEKSKKFDVTEGVLQGESLSPDLFLLFLYDIERFFRGADARGLDINGINDLLMILFADDMVILAYSHVDLMRKLKLLEEYCDLNGLTVNSSKTEIITFKAAGRLRECPEHFRRFKGICLNIVNVYSYLGVKISSSTRGLTALQSAINKAKCAIGATVSLLARTKCDSLKVYTKLFDSMVASVFLYAFPAWGLWYRNSLELVQTQFYKRIYNLPRNTPDWALRLEFGLTPILWKAMHLLWNWTVKTLKDQESSLSKICLTRLVQLAKMSPLAQPFNWVTQLREFLIECDGAELMETMDPCLWEAKANYVFNNYKSILINKDLESARLSRSLEFSIQRPLQLAPAKYVTYKMSLNVKRIFAQIRLANKLYCRLIINKQSIRFTPNTSCQLCNMYEPDNIEHFLLKCPLFSTLRMHYLGGFLAPDVPLSSLLSTTDSKLILAFVNYTEKSAQLRAWALNQ